MRLLGSPTCSDKHSAACVYRKPRRTPLMGASTEKFHPAWIGVTVSADIGSSHNKFGNGS
jgi:hypothetical protein